MDQNNYVYSACIVPPGAFNSVSRLFLMNKLKLFSFKADALKLHFSVSSHRNQQVVINNTVLDIIEIVQGVPQVTRLGPLLFNIYFDNFPKYISKECRIIQDADDCLIYSATTFLKCLKVLLHKLDLSHFEHCHLL